MNVVQAVKRPPLVSLGKHSTKRRKNQESKAIGIKTRKARVIEAYRNRGKIRLKDKHGNNVKQHFGIWKYFIHSYAANKEKFYISLDCQKYKGEKAFEIANHDKLIKNEYLSKMGRVGIEGNAEDISYWGIPFGICNKFKTLFNISKLYPWQVECLSLAIPEGLNLLYSVPTSGGKSLVAEVMMLRAVLCEKRRAIYILPYISLVSEKTQYLKKLTEDINVKIEQFHGLGKCWVVRVE